jgi:hypothetical protein
VIDEDGIRMDPDKVDSIINWKTPVNHNALRSFLGAIGFLADDIYNVRVPMGVLSEITGDTVPFHWEFTQQCAFEEIKCYVVSCKGHHRVPLDYSEWAPPIWLMTDTSGWGIAAVVAQGTDWKLAKVAALYSAKLNPAQQNYAVHEQEMLSRVEGMLHHRDILQGARFTWLTDHKGLIHLLNQKDLTGQQACWMEKLREFDFNVQYLPGEENILPDALSQLYSHDVPGTMQAVSEFTEYDDSGMELPRACMAGLVTMPVLVGPDVLVSSQCSAHIAAAHDTLPAGPATSLVKAPLRRWRPMPSGVETPAWGRLVRTVEPTETGCPETVAEFARRVAPHFIL